MGPVLTCFPSFWTWIVSLVCQMGWPGGDQRVAGVIHLMLEVRKIMRDTVR
jgi:hypothetical protein